MNELLTTPNLISSNKGLVEVQQAIKKLKNNIEIIDIILYNPFEYIYLKSDSNFQIENNIEYYLKGFNEILDTDFNNVRNIYKDRLDISGLTDFINETSIIYHQIINRNGNENKLKLKKTDTKNISKSRLLNWVNDGLQIFYKHHSKIKNLDPNFNFLL